MTPIFLCPFFMRSLVELAAAFLLSELTLDMYPLPSTSALLDIRTLGTWTFSKAPPSLAGFPPRNTMPRGFSEK